MKLPKFLYGDNTDYPNDIFIIHTEYPRFIINLLDDEVEWLDDLKGDEAALTNEIMELFEQANDFYENELDVYESEED